jgi:hypothetical protein
MGTKRIVKLGQFQSVPRHVLTVHKKQGGDVEHAMLQHAVIAQQRTTDASACHNGSVSNDV